MGAIKHYLSNVVCACSDEGFGQDAVEHAILTNAVELTYDHKMDVSIIMHRYDVIVENYKQFVSHEPAITNITHFSGKANQRRKTAPRQTGQQLLLRTQS